MDQGMKAQPQAGLAALAQPPQAPRGMPAGDMEEIMARARKMSDAQLADILAGKSMDVPQFVAMTEAMGRKSLRQAVQGQQAMAQAKQPSIKDRFLTEEAQQQLAAQMAQAPQMGGEGQGLSALPARNMEEIGMAGGGIIAFDAGGDVEDTHVAALVDGKYRRIPGFTEQDYRNSDPRIREKAAEMFPGKEITSVGLGKGKYRPDEGVWQRAGFMPYSESAVKQPPNAGAYTSDDLRRDASNLWDKISQGLTFERARKKIQEEAAKPHPSNAPDPTRADVINFMGEDVTPTKPDAKAEVKPTAKPVIAGGGGGGGGSGSNKVGGTGATGATGETAAGLIPSYEEMQKRRSEDYLGSLADASKKYSDSLEKVKEQGQGEALMALARGLFAKPTLAQGLAEGMPGVIAASSATRKEIRDIQKFTDEYNLNLAKAREAAEKGDMALAIQYQHIANEAKAQKDLAEYHMGQLAVERGKLGIMAGSAGQEPPQLRLLRAIAADPKLAAIYQGGKNVNTVSRADALKEWGDLMPSQQKKYGSFNDYYNSINNSTMGGGFDLQAAAAAEIARRNK